MSGLQGGATLSLKSEKPAKKYSLSSIKVAVIGRAPDCQIALDPFKFITVSRRHAQIELVNDTWHIKDLGTTNGTLVNDMPIASSKKLEAGDRISLGSQGPEFTFEYLELDRTAMVSTPKASSSPTSKSESESKPPIEAESVSNAKPTIESSNHAATTEASVSIKQIQETTSQSQSELGLEPAARVFPEEELSPVTSAKPTKSEAVKIEPSQRFHPEEGQDKRKLDVLEKSLPKPLATESALTDDRQPAKATPFSSAEPESGIIRSEETSRASEQPSVKTLWNLISVTERSQFPGHDASLFALEFSPDGNILASAAKDKTIKLWDTSSRLQIARFTGHKLAVNAMAFSPDGNVLASGSADKTIKLWQVNNQTEMAKISAHKLAVESLCFSPDGNVLASGSADQTIKLWQVNNQTEMTKISAHKLAVESLCFSPDGKILASGSADKTIKFWNIESREEIATLPGHKQAVSAIAFSPDGNTLASGSADKTIKLWGVATRVEIASLSTPHWQTGAIAFSTDGRTIAGSDDSGIIRLWQV